MSERIVLTVHAIGSTDAQERAKALARLKGYRVLTVARVSLVLGQVYVDDRREALAWEVTFAVEASGGR